MTDNQLYNFIYFSLLLGKHHQFIAKNEVFSLKVLCYKSSSPASVH